MAEMFLSFQQIQSSRYGFLFMLPVSKKFYERHRRASFVKTRPEFAGMIQIEMIYIVGGKIPQKSVR